MKPLIVTDILHSASSLPSKSGISTYSNDRKLNKHFISYRDISQRCKLLAQFLSHQYISTSSVIGTLAWNHSNHVEIAYGTICYGCIFHPINPRFTIEQLIYVINHAENKIIFYNKDFTELVFQLQSLCPIVQKWINIDSIEYTDIFNILMDPEWSWPELEETHLASLCYTSGTTGMPKGVAYNHRTIMLYAICSSLPDALCLSAKEVIYPYVNIFHVNAWGLLFSSMLTGATLILSNNIQLKKNIVRIITQEEVTFSAAVPTFWNMMFEEIGQDITLGSLKRVLISGSACPHLLIQRFDEHNIAVIQTWGMTELGSFATSSYRCHSSVSKLNINALNQGTPLVGIELKCTSSEFLHRDISNTTGKLYVKGYWVLDRYYKQSDSCLEHGWFYTGDIAKITSDNQLVIEDREKDIIKIGGEWISSVYIEQIALNFKKKCNSICPIDLVACIGVPDSLWGEIPILFLQSSLECIDQQMQLRSQLELYLNEVLPLRYVPRDIIFSTSFPLTATGKIQKKELRHQFISHLK
jgi:acyl-CoA synthetase (AMP-forming)/AMP-acid ligase II